ncbi:MAG TPA: phosphatidylglycerophosphatase A [Candidatus Omnitrophota bacterium]|nr:phosphatidylglycerophosphatase A [Candidatus Omnitrophota bacterium]
MQPFLVKQITTFMGVGYLPLVPGTFGSAAGLGIFLSVQGQPLQVVLILAVLLALGLGFGGQAEKVFGKKDPKFVVIDEVCGMLISLLFLPRYDLQVLALAFVLFRGLDTVKIFPAGKIQDMHGAVGIIGDDVVAAVYTNAILQVVLRVLS